MIVSEPPSSIFRAAPKKRFGGIEGDRVDAARQRPARRREGQVVGAREARDRVEQDHDVAAGLDLALGDLERHLGDVGVVLGRLVEGRADDLALDAPAHVRDLLGPLADERDHEEDVRVVRGDAVGHGLQEHRLAGLRRADDERALALADRVDQVDHPLAEVLGVALEVDQLVRVDRRQVVEDRPAASRLDVDAVDRVDPEEAPVLLLLARGADGARDAVADAQAEAADLAGADVDVLGARQQAVPAHEAVALVDDVEDAGRVVEAGALRLALEDRVDEVVLALVRPRVELEVAPDLAQLGDAHLAEVGDVEVVALAGGLELLLLVVFGHGGAAAAAHLAAAAARAAVAHGALIRSGHRVGVHLLGNGIRGARCRARPRQDVSARGPGWGCDEYRSTRRASSINRPIPSALHESVDARSTRGPTVRAVRPRRRGGAARRPPSAPPAGRAGAGSGVRVARAPRDREIAAALAIEGAAAWVALRDGALVGYIVGAPKADATWGPNIWIEVGRARRRRAGGRPRAVRGGGRRLGRAGTDEPPRPRARDGRGARRRLVPARLRPAAPARRPRAAAGREFARHPAERARSSASPSGRTSRRWPSSRSSCRATRRARPSSRDCRCSRSRTRSAELESDWGDPKWTIFVAEHEGRVIGSSVGCDLSISSSHTALMRPRHTGFLGCAAVFPDARGLGAGRALGEAVLAWSRDAGYDWAATDWRSTNLEADAHLADARLPPDVPAPAPPHRLRRPRRSPASRPWRARLAWRSRRRRRGRPPSRA